MLHAQALEAFIYNIICILCMEFEYVGIEDRTANQIVPIIDMTFCTLYSKVVNRFLGKCPSQFL